MKYKRVAKSNNNFVFILISDDFKYVVCKGFTTIKNNPFFGVYLEDFDYDLQDNYVTFNDENRAENALNHFYIKELMNKENIRLRSYCMSKNTVKLK
jgi:hypothetical protein